MQGAANCTTSGTAGLVGPTVSIAGFTDVLGRGHIDVSVDGDVTLEEVAGDLRAGMIRSRGGDVTLTSRAASIVDAPAGADAAATAGDSDADVVGVHISLFALSGGIGSTTNFLEIDSSNDDGVAAETAGCSPSRTRASSSPRSTGSRHPSMTSGCSSSCSLADVTLTTRAGSIVDALGDSVADVYGDSIDLDANGGSIGIAGDDLEIDSQYTGTGDVGLEASTSIWLTEVDGTLRLVLAEALGGDVTITVRESADLDEDLDLLHDGKVWFTENAERTIPRGRIAATGFVLLRVGDDVTSTPNSEIVAGGAIDIYGDYTNGDTGYGTTIVLRGDITPGAASVTNIWGHTDVDRFQLGDDTGIDPTDAKTTVDSPGYIHLGGDTRIHGSAVDPAAVDADGDPVPDGEDEFTVWYLQTMNVAAGHTLVLDGQAETDHYTFYTTGSRGSPRNYVAYVLDTGNPDDGVDELAIYGYDSTLNGNSAPTTPHPYDDLFLLRAVTGIEGEEAIRPAFVALLHTTLAVAAPGGTAVLAANAFMVERIGYDTALNGRLTVFGLGGNDYFATDDTTVLVTLDGGAGDDAFQIGQLYGLQRDATDATGPCPARQRAGRSPRTTCSPPSRRLAAGSRRARARRSSHRAASATTASRSTRTRRRCGSRATTATTCSWCGPSPSPRRRGTARLRRARRARSSGAMSRCASRCRCSARASSRPQRRPTYARAPARTRCSTTSTRPSRSRAATASTRSSCSAPSSPTTSSSPRRRSTVRASRSPTRRSRSSRSTGSRATTSSMCSRPRRAWRPASSAGSARTSSTWPAT